MKSSTEAPKPTCSLPPTRLPVGFDASTDGKTTIEIAPNPWDWPQIKQLLDYVSSLSDNGETTDSTIENEHDSAFIKVAIAVLANRIAPHLPGGKVALREILAKVKSWTIRARRGNPEAKAILRPYLLRFMALAQAVRYRLAETFCRPNRRDWDKRAYRFFQELQYNLGKFRRVHFVTLTFAGDPDYARVRKLLKDYTGNHLYRQGFESVEVVASHPEDNKHGRIHVHMLCWSKRTRSLRAERSVLERVQEAVSRAGRGIGFTDYQVASGPAEILKVCAYLAFNYSRTLRQPKGPDNPIPKSAHVLSRPENSLPNIKWIKVGKITPVTRATTSWRLAVSKYAAATGRPFGGDLRWIWRERRRIREYIEPLGCWEVNVTGLDGYTYRVSPDGVDCVGNETYLLLSSERDGFHLTQSGLDDLAAFQIVPGALPKNPRLDLTTGKAPYVYEVFGMLAFMSRKKRRNVTNLAGNPPKCHRNAARSLVV